MRLNLRYVIPVMCGTCIALTVSVAAAVSGVPENEEFSPPASESKTESRVFHAYDFTAASAYSAGNIIGSAESAADGAETAESSESGEITAEAEMTGESSDIGIDLPEYAESAEILAETNENADETTLEADGQSAEALSEADGQSVETLPEAEKQSVEALPEADKQSAETLPEADKQSAEALPEAEKQSVEALPEAEKQSVEALPEADKQSAETLPEADKQSVEAPAETAVAGYDEPQRQAMLEAVNAVRAEYGLAALSEMPEISEIAQQRARECASYFSHTRPNGSKWYTLLEEAGLKRNVRAENIAYYYPTAQQALNSWLNDYSHRVNILSAEAVYIGIGYYNDGYNSYWVQIFLGA